MSPDKEKLLKYAALLGPLVPGELGPLTLEEARRFFAPVWTEWGPVYDRTPPRSPSHLKKRLALRIAAEWMAKEGWRLRGVAHKRGRTVLYLRKGKGVAEAYLTPTSLLFEGKRTSLKNLLTWWKENGPKRQALVL